MRLLSEHSAANRNELGKAALTLNSHTMSNPNNVTSHMDMDGTTDEPSEGATPASGSTKLKLNLGSAPGTSGGSEAAEALDAAEGDGEEGEVLED